jgi:hypothetical protein
MYNIRLLNFCEFIVKTYIATIENKAILFVKLNRARQSSSGDLFAIHYLQTCLNIRFEVYNTLLYINHKYKIGLFDGKQPHFSKIRVLFWIFVLTKHAIRELTNLIPH